MNFVYSQKTVQNSLGIASTHPQTQSADMNTRLYNNASCCHLSISVAKFRLFVLFRNQFSAPSVLTARPFSVLTARPFSVLTARPFYLIMYTGGVYIGEGLSLTDLHYAERFCFSKNSFHGVFYRIKKRQNKQGFFSLLSAFSTRKRINLLRIMRTTRKLLITAGFINRVLRLL